MLEAVQSASRECLLGDSFCEQLEQLKKEFGINRSCDKAGREILRVFALFSIRKGLSYSTVQKMRNCASDRLFQRELMDAAKIPHTLMDAELVELVTVGVCCADADWLFSEKSTLMFGRLLCGVLGLPTSVLRWKLRVSLASLGLLFLTTSTNFGCLKYILKETFELALERHKRKKIRLPGMALACMLYLSAIPFFLGVSKEDYVIAEEMKLSQGWLCLEALVRSMEDVSEAEEEGSGNALAKELSLFGVKWVFVHVIENGVDFRDGRVAQSDRFACLLSEALKRKLVCVKELDCWGDFEEAEEGLESFVLSLLNRRRFGLLASFGKEGIRLVANNIAKLLRHNAEHLKSRAGEMAHYLNEMAESSKGQRKERAALLKKCLEEEGFDDVLVLAAGLCNLAIGWNSELRASMLALL
ncbi:uncharacterized protein MONOS_7300 [Monocercomonoides exilis]|uniref:uncharacterized protein n=1 Tax=Monocercomonoides exilis TaxID=2049356 RepID=UPI0035593D15|nr:hypothetical protein MONOS_7300 [Monocercomonoides exilis]|eukprot:MONOS_7300.1-p1 / transcript=MONOS_7300.1 / gene=MONOS_7300 / organism=Monocercomonoides_exilis_PA203 / gene_product=unspecified product / transcript_product=unspecified product / location=Mono_scaffold00247:7582-9083(-) / protein_length=415 / sequence_SO=supercontig / SO=protein_coding / is_pseudo=false